VEDKILKTFEEAGLILTEEKAKSFVVEKTLIFLGELDKWSARISLISKGDQGHILERHFVESLQYLKGIKDTNQLIDIGSGAGFPGIPLKICFPEIKMVFVESQRKRAGFLESALRTMNLQNYEVVNERAEELNAKKEYQQAFDVATFRSVASLDECLGLGAPFLKNEGKILIKKEPDFDSQGLDPMFFSEEFYFDANDHRKSKLMAFKKRST
jgi:16S rRNA (guanine527-N7)-methyltransferase